MSRYVFSNEDLTAYTDAVKKRAVLEYILNVDPHLDQPIIECVLDEIKRQKEKAGMLKFRSQETVEEVTNDTDRNPSNR